MKHILALDLGTTTGWAFRASSGVWSGSESFKPNRFESAGMRFIKMARWLEEMSDRAEVQMVLFEAVRNHVAIDAAHAYGGYLATLQSWCEKHHIPYQGVAVQTIKKSATGKGNAKKDAMILAAQALGYTPKDDNEADALHLLHWGMKEYDAAPRIFRKRPPSDSLPSGRVPVGPLPVVARRVRRR